MITICAGCGNAVDIVATEAGITYRHTVSDPDDHPVVPVEAPPGWLGRCDFCNETPPTHVLPARDFTIPHAPTHSSLADWAACPQCAALIERNHWSALTRRAERAIAVRRGRPMRPREQTSLRALYRQLREHIRGPLRLIDDDACQHRDDSTGEEI